jgi:hypothetical protein
VARLLLAHLDVCAYHLVRPVAVAVAVSASASAVVLAVPVETSVYQLEAVVRCAFLVVMVKMEETYPFVVAAQWQPALAVCRC